MTSVNTFHRTKTKLLGATDVAQLAEDLPGIHDALATVQAWQLMAVIPELL